MGLHCCGKVVMSSSQEVMERWVGRSCGRHIEVALEFLLQGSKKEECLEMG